MPVSTAPDVGGEHAELRPLPAPTAEQFILAGATLAERASRERAGRWRVEEILRRAVGQAELLRGEAV